MKLEKYEAPEMEVLFESGDIITESGGLGGGDTDPDA